MLRQPLQPLLRPLLRRIDESAPGGFVPSLNLNFLSSALDPRVTFIRASNATRVNASGLIELVAVNEPRFDYDPVTLAPKGLLIEEQRTNLCLYSRELDSVLYTQWQFSIGAGAWAPTETTVAPDGTVSGRTYTAVVGGNANTGYQVMAVTAATVYTWSLYVKLGTLPQNELKIAFRDDTAGVFIAQDIAPTLISVGGGWGRLTYTLTTPVGCGLLRCYVIRNTGPAVGGTVSFWGAQLEAGAFPTSYIPTTTAAATRAADVAVMTGSNFSSWYRQDEGTLFADAGVLSVGYTGGVLLDIGAGGAFGTTAYLNWNGSAWGVNPTTAPVSMLSGVTTTSPAKIAAALSANNTVVAANGILGAVDTSCAMPASPTTLSIGVRGWSSGNGNFFNGHIRRIAYFPRRLANSELQAITS